MTQQQQPSPPKVLAGPFAGKFGDWYLTQDDENGVMTYRLAMASTALCTAFSAGLALTGGRTVPPAAYDAVYAVATLSFGVALQTIHIYLRPLHNALKACWMLGAIGALVLALSPLTGHSVVVAVHDQPALLLAVGWQFIALTGLFIKEAACFGRIEATALILLTPVLSGGRFLSVLPDTVEKSGAIVYAGLFLFFALRKFSQPTTDDLGDKSVFDYLDKGGEL